MSTVLIAEVIAIGCLSSAGMAAANRAYESGPHARPCPSRVKTAFIYRPPRPTGTPKNSPRKESHP